jgi:hypothetical protein
MLYPLARASLVILALAGAAPALAQDENQDLKQELERLRREFEEFKKEFEPQEGLPKRAADEAKRSAGGVYSKPFLARFGRNVYLGGYMDLEYIAVEGGATNTFDQHRLVPFIYADISRHVKLATEIEIEHGNGTELGVEFATLDLWMADEFNFRAGIILLPLGKFNLVHDAPFQDLTRRPLPVEFITTVVLRDPGVGFFGTIDLDPWLIAYEIYVSNGFKGLGDLAAENVITSSKGLRDARPHDSKVDGTKKYRDFNRDKAVTGRLSMSPFLGLEFGVSGHRGKYDQNDNNLLHIAAYDATLAMGGIFNALFEGEGFLRDLFFATEIVIEASRARLERDALATAAGVLRRLEGNFGEIRFHFMPGFLKPVFEVSDESTFTLVFRLEKIDLDGARRYRQVVGLNYRPTEDTVIKIEFEKNAEGGTVLDVDNDAFLFSFASYF